MTLLLLLLLCSLDSSGSLLSSTLNNLSLLWFQLQLTTLLQIQTQITKVKLMFPWELNLLGYTMLVHLLLAPLLLLSSNLLELFSCILLKKLSKHQEITQLSNWLSALVTVFLLALKRSLTTLTKLLMHTWLFLVMVSVNQPGMDSCLT